MLAFVSMVAAEKAFAGMEIVVPGSAPRGLTAANTISRMPAAVKQAEVYRLVVELMQFWL